MRIVRNDGSSAMAGSEHIASTTASARSRETIPGVAKKGASQFDEADLSTELYSAELMENLKKAGNRKLDEAIPDPWDGKW